MEHTQTFSQVRFEALSSTDESRRKPVKITGASHLERGSGPDYFAYAYVFVSCIIICRLHILNLSNKAKVHMQQIISINI
jgi:hypothetical protein